MWICANLGVHSYDLDMPATASTDHTGGYGGGYDSAGVDRLNGIIYISALNGGALRAYDTATQMLMSLSPHPAIGNHSSLTFVADASPPTCTVSGPMGSASAGVPLALDSSCPLAETRAG